uniref:[histone H3]-dimethyl-L-lysine(36) demethylase n=1 Tax=Biomphalaria glabrata TaxID=6526 RepID=A0A2C9KCL6_BIOGL
MFKLVAFSIRLPDVRQKQAISFKCEKPSFWVLPSESRTKERKKYVDQEIDEDDIDGRRMYSVEEKLLSDKFNANLVQEMKGPEFTMDWMQRNGLVRPIVFLDKTGLGLRVPSENFKVSDVKQCVGSRRVLDVMDVNTQKAMEMSMKDWVKYYENPERDRLLNVISLEFCHTRLENYVDSPTLVRQVDWVDRAWPRHLKECQTESTNVIEKMKYPKVQKYCLMSVAGCYTDFHIDFGGTSVWYHILHGEKIFWLAPPSPKNIDKYTEWTLSAKQGETFLGDSLEQCQRIVLYAGNTFIIPSGWIHAVYTPKDSLVFGGNFLHSFNIENQLLVSRIEDKTYVPSKFRYPFFSEIMWYVVDRYISCLTGHTYLASVEKDEVDEDDQGLIQVDEDSRPPSRNPDSRPPSRTMDDSMDSKMSGEDAPKLSKSVTIELTRIDQALKRSQSEDENQPSVTKPRVPRKAVSDSNSSWEGGGGTRKWVHLTPTELRGLRQLVDYLQGLMALPVNKRGIPKELLDPDAVLREIKQILEDHKNDDPDLAVTGDPVIGWPESAKKKQQKLKLGYKTFKTTKTAKGTSSSSSSIRRRRTRCKKCEACTRTECGECTFCKDMKKFGGPGRMKQTCISRQCMAPILPSSSVCVICNQEGQPNLDDSEDFSCSLMECGICWEIVHPSCLQKNCLGSFDIMFNYSYTVKNLDNQIHDLNYFGSNISAPNSPTSSDSSTRHQRKRPSSMPGSSGDKTSSSSQSEPGGKRPKREGPACVMGEGTMDFQDSLLKQPEELHGASPSGSGVSCYKKSKMKQGVFESFDAIAAASPFSSFSSLSSPASSQAAIGMQGAMPPLSSCAAGQTPASELPSGQKDESKNGLQDCGGDQVPRVSAEKLRWGTDYAPKVPLKNYVIRPAPQTNIPEFVTMADNTPHPLPHAIWTLIFHYLPQSDLVKLSSVCRTFDCWALDPTLWYQINLSRKSIKQVHLKGVMLRQPRSLKLASSVISYAQLSWLIARLPGLRHLDLSNLSWASICALCSSDCPLLRSLNLSWATGIRDLCFRELASPPINLKPGQRNISRLSCLERLSLTGTDINDQSLEVIATHLPKLMALDLTCCMRVTDRGIKALVQLGAPCHLREIKLVKCVQLTERCLESLASCRDLSFLALTDIPAITQEACMRFSRNYKYRTLRAHAQGIISV